MRTFGAGVVRLGRMRCRVLILPGRSVLLTYGSLYINLYRLANYPNRPRHGGSPFYRPHFMCLQLSWYCGLCSIRREASRIIREKLLSCWRIPRQLRLRSRPILVLQPRSRTNTAYLVASRYARHTILAKTAGYSSFYLLPPITTLYPFCSVLKPTFYHSLFHIYLEGHMHTSTATVRLG
jgi:hypothetical protein